MDHRFYPKIGGTLTWACEKLATDMGIDGSIIVLYRGKNELAEMGMSFSPELNFGPESFRQMIDPILKRNFSDFKPHKACVRFAEATDSESVIIFLLAKNGNVQIIVSGPTGSDFIAACALQVANSLDAMN
jgi:hypothetical protein